LTGLLFLPEAGNTDLDDDPVDGLTRLGLRTEHGEHSRILSRFRDQTKDPIQANFLGFVRLTIAKFSKNVVGFI
jgi:hypothetical protein